MEAAAATKDGPKSSDVTAPTEEHMKRWAAHCFDTLITKLKSKSKLKYPVDLPDPKYALFVTWTVGKEEDLRGCIGTFSQDQNLSDILGEYALVSSLEDDRFEPITLEEVPTLNVGLSLLVNFRDIDDPLAWEVGRHGIEIEFSKRGRHYSSTFLPEVAAEEGWDQATTLEYLVDKAGWRRGIDSVQDSIKARTYESLKYKLTYAQYQQMKSK